MKQQEKCLSFGLFALEIEQESFSEVALPMFIPILLTSCFFRTVWKCQADGLWKRAKTESGASRGGLRVQIGMQIILTGAQLDDAATAAAVMNIR